ncbi:3-oxoacyl-ACP synthase III family protein [Streptomyces lunaelactis]|uniref:3-oxoacyl-ACP synthase III family protein n=1 Tax=Streptomyces lunaelactis TaxID=1535768 RepID=UPI0020C74C04|nr:hypothetical protein [Streptomyces lunaelactis]
MSVHSRIAQVAVHLPPGRQTAQAIEDRLRRHSPGVRVPARLLTRLYGLQERIVADDGDLPSDLASRAVLQALRQAETEPGDIDLLLFAAVSADVQEPANAHIVASKTGLTCPVFDVSNACNSVLNALEVADAFIRCGAYGRVLVACGETLSRLSRWTLTGPDELRTALASLTGGDMGAALLIEASPEPGIIATTSMANSAGWPAATLFNPYHAPGLPKGLHIDSDRLLASFLGLDTQAKQWLKSQHSDPNTLGLLCVHQPSVPFVHEFCARLGVPSDTVVPTFHRTGNMGAANPPPPTRPRHRTRPPPTRHQRGTLRPRQRRQRRSHTHQLDNPQTSPPPDHTNPPLNPSRHERRQQQGEPSRHDHPQHRAGTTAGPRRAPTRGRRPDGHAVATRRLPPHSPPQPAPPTPTQPRADHGEVNPNGAEQHPCGERGAGGRRGRQVPDPGPSAPSRTRTAPGAGPSEAGR